MWKPKISRSRTAGVITFAIRMVTAAVLATAAPETPVDTVIALDQLPGNHTLVLNGDLFHVQGLDVDQDFVYVSSVDRKAHRGFLHKFTRAGAFVQSVELTDGVRYHPGGISIDGNTIWIPVAEYRSASSTRMIEIDKTTLRTVSSFIVHDHIGAVAARDGKLYGGNWDSKRLYVWTHTGKSLAAYDNPTGVAYQDLKFVGNHLVGAGISRDHLTGSIDWLNPDTMQPTARWPVGRAATGVFWTHEGMTIADGKLYLMPSDGLNGRVDVGTFDVGEVQTAVDALTMPQPMTIAAR